MQRVVNHRSGVSAIGHSADCFLVDLRRAWSQFHFPSQIVQRGARVFRCQGMFERRQCPLTFGQRMTTGCPRVRLNPKRFCLGMMRRLPVQERNQNAGIEESSHLSWARLRITASASSSPTSPVHFRSPVRASRESFPFEKTGRAGSSRVKMRRSPSTMTSKRSPGLAIGKTTRLLLSAITVTVGLSYPARMLSSRLGRTPGNSQNRPRRARKPGGYFWAAIDLVAFINGFANPT